MRTLYTDRLRFIDALRGLAALYVVFFHIDQKPQAAFPGWIQPFMANGYTGVQLFFIVSAFTLCYTFFDRRNEPGAIRGFYTRRIFRIIPLYYCWLAIMIAWLWKTLSLTYLPAYLSFTFNFIPGQQSGIIWLSWTLAVEMIFYLFFPFLVKIVSNLARSIIFILIALLLSVLHAYFLSDVEDYTVEMGFLHQLPVFAIGMTAFFLYRKIGERTVSPALAWSIFFAGISGIILFAYFPLGSFHVYVLAVLYAGMLLGLYVNPVRPLVNRFTVFAGLISYSLYLSHPMIIHYFVVKNSFFRKMDLTQPSALLYCTVAILVTAFAVSYFTYRFIEQPFIRLGRKILRKQPTAVVEEEIAI